MDKRKTAEALLQRRKEVNSIPDEPMVVSPQETEKIIETIANEVIEEEPKKDKKKKAKEHESSFSSFDDIDSEKQ